MYDFLIYSSVSEVSYVPKNSHYLHIVRSEKGE